jgi:hypothetical protein
MKIVLLVFTDGRADCLLRTIQSFEKNLSGSIDARLLIDDSANPGYSQWLNDNFSDYAIFHNEKRLGFAGAVQRGMKALPKDTDFVFWLEDDFVLLRKIKLSDLAAILSEHPYLSQIVLKRQPVNSIEKQAGGIVEIKPDDFTEVTERGKVWTEHSRNFSTNPSLVPYSITQLGWPDAPDSERKFSGMLKANGYRFAFYGKKFEQPMVEHIGDQRVGTGY